MKKLLIYAFLLGAVGSLFFFYLNDFVYLFFDKSVGYSHRSTFIFIYFIFSPVPILLTLLPKGLCLKSSRLIKYALLFTAITWIPIYLIHFNANDPFDAVFIYYNSSNPIFYGLSAAFMIKYAESRQIRLASILKVGIIAVVLGYVGLLVGTIIDGRIQSMLTDPGIDPMSVPSHFFSLKNAFMSLGIWYWLERAWPSNIIKDSNDRNKRHIHRT